MSVENTVSKVGVYRHIAAARPALKKPARVAKSAGPEKLDVESSFIDSIEWDGSLLWVNIGGNSYWYPSSSAQFHAFARAESAGRFYNTEVKLR